ncbi:MAG TPA: hypothetical protein VFA22_00490 [Stellaceae bacterium]|nr:hypothetical protein [Stellaceae bacterium]
MRRDPAWFFIDFYRMQARRFQRQATQATPGGRAALLARAAEYEQKAMRLERLTRSRGRALRSG